MAYRARSDYKKAPLSRHLSATRYSCSLVLGIHLYPYHPKVGDPEEHSFSRFEPRCFSLPIVYLRFFSLYNSCTFVATNLKHVATGIVFFLSTALAAPTEDVSSRVGSSGAKNSEVHSKSQKVPCGESFLSRLHDNACCVFFDIPQSGAQAENDQHFRNCCFGKGKAFNQKLKEEKEQDKMDGGDVMGTGEEV